MELGFLLGMMETAAADVRQVIPNSAERRLGSQLLRSQIGRGVAIGIVGVDSGFVRWGDLVRHRDPGTLERRILGLTKWPRPSIFPCRA